MTALRALVLCLLLGHGLQAADAVRLLVVSRNTQLLPKAFEGFQSRHGSSLIDLQVADDSVRDEQVSRATAIFFYYNRPETYQRLAPAIERAAAAGALILAYPSDNAARYWHITIDTKLNSVAGQYWEAGGIENLQGFLEFIYSRLGTTHIEVTPPREQAASGIYHPLAEQPFHSLSEYLAWYGAKKKLPSTAPLVGIMMYHQTYKFHDLAHVDALIRALENRGIGAVPVYGWPVSSLQALLTIDGRTPMRLLIALNLGFSKQDDAVALEKLGLHVINAMTASEPLAVWQASEQGIVPHRLPALLNAPERVGASEPIVIATSEKTASGSTVTQPIAERIQATVDRVLRWIRLQDLANSGKRVAFLYYSNPPGKGYLGASYLAIMPTLVAILHRLKQEGYQTGNSLPDEKELVDLLHRSGRNIEIWAPGELDELVNRGHVTLVSMHKYVQWFRKTPVEFQHFVEKEWGTPESSRLMTITSRDGEKYFVIPGVRFGNVFVGPQPLRSTFERATDVTHDTVTPPPHSYIAAYLWYRNEFHADAAVHLGRHGTLEWLPGKHVGQAGADSSEVLLGDLPAAYYFIVDGGGEAIQAKRRSASVMISHLTPMIVAGGRQGEFLALETALDNAEKTETSTPALADEYRKQVLTEVVRLKLDRELGINVQSQAWPEVKERIEDLLHSVENGPAPMGLHAVGASPRTDVLRDAAASFIRFGFGPDDQSKINPHISRWVDALFDKKPTQVPSSFPAPLREKVEASLEQTLQWLHNIAESGDRELDALIGVLQGRYLASGLLGDPLRVPAAVPTGRNLHDFDTSQIPTKAAWELGKKLAIGTINRYQREKGAFPEKVSMVLWYGETGRNHGAMESQALYLMGVEPRWNSRGVVDSLRLIPDAELGRPRVDVVFTISGIYRDGFGDKLLLLDRAAKMVAAAGDNPLRRHNREIEAALRKAGVDAKLASQTASARVFGAQPGNYGTGIQQIVEQSKDDGKEKGLAEMYLHHMNFVYSSDLWGANVNQALQSHLRGNQAVIHSRTTNVYGVLDNDDFYQFAGGLNVASKSVNHGVPQFYVDNLRVPGQETVENFRTFLVKELNTRQWNPKWIREMQRSGYAGARQFAKELEHLYGWQATSGEHVDGQLWQRTFDVYVADRHGLNMDQFFERENPHVRQFILSRLLEVDRQGTYRFSEQDRAKLVKEYVISVAHHGVACSANTCGNLGLNRYAASEAALVAGLGQSDLANFGRRLGDATYWRARQFASAPAAVRSGMMASARSHTNPPQSPSPAAKSAPAPKPHAGPDPVPVSGYRMEEKSLSLRAASGPGFGGSGALAACILMLIAVGAARRVHRLRALGLR